MWLMMLFLKSLRDAGSQVNQIWMHGFASLSSQTTRNAILPLQAPSVRTTKYVTEQF